MSNHFVVVPNSGRWEIRRLGSSTVLSTRNSRREAESAARTMGRSTNGVVSFRDSRGRFAGSVTYSR